MRDLSQIAGSLAERQLLVDRVDQRYLLALEQRDARRYWALDVFVSNAERDSVSRVLEVACFEVHFEADDVALFGASRVLFHHILVDLLATEAHHAPLLWRGTQMIREIERLAHLLGIETGGDLRHADDYLPRIG